MSKPAVIDYGPPSYNSHSWRRIWPARPRWLIVHDPGAKAPLADENMVSYLRRAPATYHDYLYRADDDSLRVVVLVPRDRWCGHAGVATRIPGTPVVNRAVNWWTHSVSVEYGFAPLDAELLDALAWIVALRVRELGMADAGVVLGHREISTVPGRRIDPRGVDMEELRERVALWLAQAPPLARG